MPETTESILDAAVDGGATTLAVRRAVFNSMLAARGINEARICELTGLDPGAVKRAVDHLVAAGIATTDGAKGAQRLVDGAEGLTIRKSGHAIRISGSELHTWCAFDIVGIPAALGLDATGSTHCPTCLAEINLEVRKGEAVESEVVGWWPALSGGPVIEAFCPSASIFCNLNHLEAWRSATGAKGVPRTLTELAQAGRTTWARFRA
ncbi:MAG: organomercurial lyase [Nitrospiraceae bacterium]|nr:organomercurial lyase [Nitrospiraceae bacterium]